MKTATTLAAQQRANITRARAMIAQVRRNARQINRVGRMLSKLGERSGTYQYMTAYDDGVYASVTMTNLSGFRDAALTTAMLDIEMKLGIEFNKSTDYPDTVQREYVASGEMAAGGRIQITVRAQVASDSPTCRRVETGRQTIDVPTYAIVCE